MPLSADILQREIQRVIDSDFPAFIAYPEDYTVRIAAERWADALDNYFVQLTTPTIPISNVAREAGKRAAINAWEPIFPYQAFPSILTQFQNGLSAYVVAVVGVMNLPMNDPIYFWFVPNGILPSFSTIFTTGRDKTAEEIAGEIATKAHGYLRTGSNQLRLQMPPTPRISWTVSN